LQLVARDEFGNTSQAAKLVFSFDTSVPAAPAAPDLLAASDSGPSSADNVTNQTTLTVRAVGSTNAIVRLIVDGTKTYQALGSGNIDFSVGPLGQGIHSLVLTYEDLAGNVSQASAPLTVTIDTQAPNQPTLGLDAASDTAPVGDNATSLELITLVGQTSPNTTV